MNRPTGDERRNVGILAANQALFLIAAITVMTLSGIVGQRLAPTPALATLPIALMMVGVVLAALPASLLMKRVGRRTGFIVGALVGGAGGGALSVWAITLDSFWLFCAGNLLLGLYQAFANYHRFAAADAASPAFESRAISLVLAGGVVAAYLGPFNASRANDLLAGLPDAGPYAVIVALAVLGAALHTRLRIPDDDEARTGQQRSMREIRSDPASNVALLAATVGYTIMILVMTATPLAMQQEGFGLPDAATVMQWHVLGMFAPSFVTGHLIARFGLPTMLLAGAAVLVGSVVVAVAGQTVGHFLVSLLLVGVGWNFLFVGGSALLATTHAPAERGKVQGANELVIFSAVAVGSLLAGALLHGVGWITLNLLMLPLVGATAVVTWRWRQTRPSAR
ncbi:MAG: MFS transporter, partial [Nitriliruptor sp.]|uniref:MFS transporter n=1 Tax=Nitriliruptor sp. TaxID=2448056 RepID=UPI0034A098B2